MLSSYVLDNLGFAKGIRFASAISIVAGWSRLLVRSNVLNLLIGSTLLGIA